MRAGLLNYRQKTKEEEEQENEEEKHVYKIEEKYNENK